MHTLTERLWQSGSNTRTALPLFERTDSFPHSGNDDTNSEAKIANQQLTALVAHAAGFLDAAAAALYRLERKTNSLVLVSGWDLPASFAARSRIHLAPKPKLQLVLANKQPAIFPSLARDRIERNLADDVVRQMLLESGCCTTLLIPVLTNELVYGALFLYCIDMDEDGPTNVELTFMMCWMHRMAAALY
ncbi:MAG TPA: hypothetical protein P5121_37800 [Caldilineaceae bacterium]|mgnify:CR=1 FL=1|nr:hypothetical protein [Caldilineaceae bacterium]